MPMRNLKIPRRAGTLCGRQSRNRCEQIAFPLNALASDDSIRAVQVQHTCLLACGLPSCRVGINLTQTLWSGGQKTAIHECPFGRGSLRKNTSAAITPAKRRRVGRLFLVRSLLAFGFRERVKSG